MFKVLESYLHGFSRVDAIRWPVMMTVMETQTHRWFQIKPSFKNRNNALGPPGLSRFEKITQQNPPLQLLRSETAFCPLDCPNVTMNKTLCQCMSAFWAFYVSKRFKKHFDRQATRWYLMNIQAIYRT
jgi:hypothetical protein